MVGTFIRVRKPRVRCEPLTATKPFKRTGDVPRAVRMGKEETLLKLKEAESQIRALKEVAERDREQARRTARREALELREKMREQAEARYREILKAAESVLAAEGDRIDAGGRVDPPRDQAVGGAK